MSTPGTVSPPLSIAGFNYVSRLVLAEAGLVLASGKQYLVESRLAPLAAAAGHCSIDDYLASLRRQPHGVQHVALVEAMTTNETSFFRDRSPFEALHLDVIPDCLRRLDANRPLRIWCGGCSTGQEPYSVAMLLSEHFPELCQGGAEILATDLAQSTLAVARAARYSQFEVKRGLPARLLAKYFTPHENEWALRPEVRSLVRFHAHNLMGAWEELPLFDIVLLRNVMIYFSSETKRGILRKLRKKLAPGGYFFLGAAETTRGLDDGFLRKTFGGAACYQTDQAGQPYPLATL